jgi:clan AA aspartic protease (TIGR02281 family)
MNKLLLAGASVLALSFGGASAQAAPGDMDGMCFASVNGQPIMDGPCKARKFFGPDVDHAWSFGADDHTMWVAVKVVAPGNAYATYSRGHGDPDHYLGPVVPMNGCWQSPSVRICNWTSGSGPIARPAIVPVPVPAPVYAPTPAPMPAPAPVINVQAPPPAPAPAPIIVQAPAPVPAPAPAPIIINNQAPAAAPAPAAPAPVVVTVPVVVPQAPAAQAPVIAPAFAPQPAPAAPAAPVPVAAPAPTPAPVRAPAPEAPKVPTAAPVAAPVAPAATTTPVPSATPRVAAPDQHKTEASVSASAPAPARAPAPAPKVVEVPAPAPMVPAPGSPPPAADTTWHGPAVAASPESKEVPIEVGDDGHSMKARLLLGSSTRVTAIVDTGATTVSIPESIANDLVGKGEAEFVDNATFTLADGRDIESHIVRIARMQVGNITLHNVLAGTAPNDAEVLLGMSALDKLGVMTVDKAHGRLLFG